MIEMTASSSYALLKSETGSLQGQCLVNTCTVNYESPPMWSPCLHRQFLKLCFPKTLSLVGAQRPLQPRWRTHPFKLYKIVSDVAFNHKNKQQNQTFLLLKFRKVSKIKRRVRKKIKINHHPTVNIFMIFNSFLIASLYFYIFVFL